MKKYHNIISRGLLVVGLLELFGSIDHRSELVEGEGFDPPHYVTIKSNYGSRVGRTAQLYLSAIDNGNIESARLFENDLLIKEFDDFGRGGFKFFEVTKNETGKHRYFFEVSDEDGNVVRTSPISINFSGTLEDRIPHHVTIKSNYGSRVGRTAQLYLGVLDYGDNAGIERAILYEDGKPIKQFDDFWRGGFKFFDVTKSKTGRHTYKFEVEDRGGHVVSSSRIRISFNP